MIQSGIQDLEMSNEEFCERVTVGYQTCSDRDLEVLRKWLKGIVNRTGSIWDLEYVCKAVSTDLRFYLYKICKYPSPRYTGNLHTCAKGKIRLT